MSVNSVRPSTEKEIQDSNHAQQDQLKSTQTTNRNRSPKSASNQTQFTKKDDNAASDTKSTVNQAQAKQAEAERSEQSLEQPGKRIDVLG